ncbi:phage portal protein [Cystobacter fuscus]
MASILSRIKNVFGSSRSRGKVVPAYFQTYGVRRGSAQILRAYKENGWLFAITNTIASGVANPIWRAYKRVDSSGKGFKDYALVNADKRTRTKALKQLQKQSELIEIPNHEVLRILNEPNPAFTGRACVKVMQTHLDLVGEAFLWLQRNDQGQVAGYIPLPPHAVVLTPTEESSSFQVIYNTIAKNISATDMIWLRNLDPENPHGRGAGAGLALGDELDSCEYISRTLRASLSRGGMPLAVVGLASKNQDDDNEEALEDLEKKYQEALKGPENAGKVWFAPGQVTMSTVNANFKELQIHDLSKAIRDFIRQTYNVSPELMGDLSSSNRSTSEEAKYTLAEYVILPRLEFWRTELQHKLIPLVDPEIILEYEDPRPQNWERIFKIMTTQPVEGFTWNEYRELAGYEPDPELVGRRPLPLPGAAPVNQLGVDQSVKSNQMPPPTLFRNV